ncbi:MAG: ribokinase [Corynebacterium sp.]|uniref:ribokinase n=1 Tax=Corynebacterium sp. TaxID=1720 RepID=UPI00264963EC|nr:ribokinase [Corynebacterium sp.]MDN6282170.1 ribokinase [Corynebacterium sp.]MDN6306609.1 ribokinase [Corynebacterium sp.]MDN6352469.1 ribokinase [Corynebacterium sp.]MDN6368056.1 ribokinase [Corynebacterium sp.]MDN6376471.1 ribokinase [Corynebacterium sp.]
MSEPTYAVVVCGTVNIDTFVGVDQFPTSGETIIAAPNGTALGGKGANQAVAAARYAAREGDVLFHATVGTDGDGDSAVAELSEFGVDVSAVGRTGDAPTGQAFIMNDPAGENIIVVTSGANALTNPATLGGATSGADSDPDSGGGAAVDSAAVLLAQGELTPEHSAALPALAERLGARFVLNLAPVTTRDRDLLASADPLIVNETEAADVLGMPRDTLLDELLDAFAAAVERGLAVSAVVTLGAQGALLVAGGERTMLDAIPVGATDSATDSGTDSAQVVDTTGAGDAFCGTLAASLAEGESLGEAARLASAAGSLAVRSRSAAASYAGREDIRRCTELDS